MIVLNKLLSFFFFIAFMTSMQFILINMFIAFISNAYSSVNEHLSEEKKKFGDELKYKHWLVKIEDVWKWVKNRSQRATKKSGIKIKGKSEKDS